MSNIDEIVQKVKEVINEELEEIKCGIATAINEHSMKKLEVVKFEDDENPGEYWYQLQMVFMECEFHDDNSVELVRDKEEGLSYGMNIGWAVKEFLDKNPEEDKSIILKKMFDEIMIHFHDTIDELKADPDIVFGD